LEFKKRYPYDFIAEAIDQTRGWFYTLHVLGTILFEDIAYKNVICAGHIIDENGEKMSKSKGNYPDPMLIANTYGADACRLYLSNSPVVRAESLQFKETGVKTVVREIFLPWFNSYRFLIQNISRYEQLNGSNFVYDPDMMSNI